MHYLTLFMMKLPKLKKKSCIGNQLSKVNDSVMGVLLKAGNWKIL